MGTKIESINTIDYTKIHSHGVVVKPAKDINGSNNEVGIYVPRLFVCDKNEPGTKSNIEINSNIFANSKNTQPQLDSQIDICTFIKAPYEGHTNTIDPIINTGEKCKINFNNSDIQRPRYQSGQVDERKRAFDRWKVSINSKQDTDKVPEDSYFIELNSVDDNRFIHIHTSKENGEVTTYDIKIDAKKGNINVKDGEGQSILLDTKKEQILFENKSESFFELLKKDINIKCKNNINFESKNFNVMTKKNINMEAKLKADYIAPKVTIKGKASINMNTINLNMNAKALTKIVCPITTTSGVFGAVSLGVSAGGNAPPTIQQINMSGSTLSPVPRDVSANGAAVVTAITALIPFTILPPIAASVVLPLLQSIPNPMVRQ